jgi:hypothetical protein
VRDTQRKMRIAQCKVQNEKRKMQNESGAGESISELLGQNPREGQPRFEHYIKETDYG